MADGIMLKQMETDIANMAISLGNVALFVSIMSDNLNKMMIGDGEVAFWNGENASKFYTRAVKKLNELIDDYQSIYDALNSYALAFEKISRGDK